MAIRYDQAVEQMNEMINRNKIRFFEKELYGSSFWWIDAGEDDLLNMTGPFQSEEYAKEFYAHELIGKSYLLDQQLKGDHLKILRAGVSDA